MRVRAVAASSSAELTLSVEREGEGGREGERQSQREGEGEREGEREVRREGGREIIVREREQ